MSLQAGCGERAGSRAAVAARGWAGVPTRTREAREGTHYTFFCDIEMLSSVRTWGREMAALGSPVSSLVITAVHSSAVNSFLLSHPSSSGGGARPDSSLPAPVRPGPGPPHSPTPKTAELAWPPAPGPRLPQLPPAGIPVEFKILPWIGVTHDIGQATTHCHGGLEQHGGKGPLRV